MIRVIFISLFLILCINMVGQNVADSVILRQDRIAFNKIIFDKEEMASAKLGVGICLHLTSIVFMEKQYRTPYLSSPFGVLTNAALFFDMVAIIDFIKIQKLKKKHRI